MSDTTELHPSAEKAIAELKKPIRPYWSGETSESMRHRQRESDLGTLHDLLLDALTKIKDRGRSSNYDPTWDIAADALEAHTEVYSFIEQRDAIAEAADLQAAE